MHRLDIFSSPALLLCLFLSLSIVSVYFSESFPFPFFLNPFSLLFFLLLLVEGLLVRGGLFVFCSLLFPSVRFASLQLLPSCFTKKCNFGERKREGNCWMQSFWKVFCSFTVAVDFSTLSSGLLWATVVP